MTQASQHNTSSICIRKTRGMLICLFTVAMTFSKTVIAYAPPSNDTDMQTKQPDDESAQVTLANKDSFADEATLNAIGKQIYLNETAGNPKHLIAWNDGEAFASVGIGHFIWFSEGLSSRFTETFPAFLHYLKQNNVPLPNWLLLADNSPWHTKAAFDNAVGGSQMQELRQLLLDTFAEQLAFIIQRQKAALPKILATLNSKLEQQIVEQRYQQLLASAAGKYAVIDYVNFKGEGISTSERYKGMGWGLLQVIQNMDEGLQINNAFADACIEVLTQRIDNSPQQEVEQKWLAGWTKRCNTYRTFLE